MNSWKSKKQKIVYKVNWTVIKIWIGSLNSQIVCKVWMVWLFKKFEFVVE